MLRVWGGGMWERDDFYALADEYGVMVWEEGKFGCSLYPVDAAFLASVKTE
jgi:beta-mannosidase